MKDKQPNQLEEHLKKIRLKDGIGPITKLYWEYLYEINLNYIFENTREKDKILDVGCGTGKYLVELAKKNRICYGIDPLVEVSLAVAQRMAEKAKVNINLLQAEGENIPFPENFFDAVLFLSTIQHVNDADKTLSEINRVLKNKGILLISAPLRKNIFNFFQDIFKPKYFTYSFSFNELKTLIQKNGFDILQIKGYGFFPPFLNIFLFAVYILFGEKITKKIIKALDIFPKIIPFTASSVVILAKKQS